MWAFIGAVLGGFVGFFGLILVVLALAPIFEGFGHMIWALFATVPGGISIGALLGGRIGYRISQPPGEQPNKPKLGESSGGKL